VTDRRNTLIAAFETSEDFVGSPDLIADVALEALGLDEPKNRTASTGCGCASPMECSGASDCEYRGVRVCPDCDEPNCPMEWTPDD
jgi:hypothetical protein